MYVNLSGSRTRVQCCIADCRHIATQYYHILIDVIMGAMASQITSITIVYSTVYSGADQIKHQSSASLAFVRGIHRWPVNSPHKWQVTRKISSWVNQEYLITMFPAFLVSHGNPSVSGRFSSKGARNVTIWCFFMVSMSKLLTKQLA